MEDDKKTTHNMITRSKQQSIEDKIDTTPKLIFEKVDSTGNLMDLIDDTAPQDFDEGLLKKELDRLRGASSSRSPKKVKSPSKKIVKGKGKKANILELILPYLIMNALNPPEAGGGNVHKFNTKKKNKEYKTQKNLSNKSFIETIFNTDKQSTIDFEIEDEDIESSEEELSEEELSEEGDSSESLSGSEEEGLEETDEESDDDEALDEESDDAEESDEALEYDEYDDQFVGMIEEEIDEDEELEYFHELTTPEKQKHITELEEIKKISKSNIPLRFKILNSEMDIRTKSIAIENIEKLGEMDVSTGEYCKMDKWINGLIRIPFGKYNELDINDENSMEEKSSFLYNTYNILDKAIYGHQEAKMHILQVIGKWIKNPTSQGNVLALQGPMGNGKTTLVKEGIAKAINRPFAFIALGGASDSAFFDGHSYTYEGSHWGRIIDIMIESKCMNPIIYFDELDKVSDTFKGQEIIHLLTHLTDPSQNNLFQDNYFPGVHIDISKSLFIFSFNDESKVDRILKDRMYVINTKGFKPEDKIAICNDYLLPELMETFRFNKQDITFDKEAIEYIIETHTEKEEGVRNLKRCLETIISKINIYNLSQAHNDKQIPLTFEIDNFSIPLNIDKNMTDSLLSKKEDKYKPPEHMYM
jgi:ATP-dependent Lon protease